MQQRLQWASGKIGASVSHVCCVEEPVQPIRIDVAWLAQGAQWASDDRLRQIKPPSACIAGSVVNDWTLRNLHYPAD
jgi:hypothetical protein